jgi:hypothetical protein
MTRKEEIKMAAEFEKGAEWADEHAVSCDGKAALYFNNIVYENGYKEAVDKACVWLRNNWRKYININADGVVCFGHWENDFRKTMKRKQI